MQENRTSGAAENKNGFFIFLAAVSLAGVLLGTLSYCYMDSGFLERISSLEENFFDARRSADYAVILMRSLCSSTLFLGAAFILGFSAVGQPLAVAVPIVRGIGLGAAMAQIYSANGTSGILTCALLLIPSALISTFALIRGVMLSVEMSDRLLSDVLSDRSQEDMLENTKVYGASFIALEAVMAVSAAIDCLCTVMFIDRI